MHDPLAALRLAASQRLASKQHGRRLHGDGAARGRRIWRMKMARHLRIARPVTDLAAARDMYCRGLGLRVVGSFENHAGFDGVMLGAEGADYHFEFTTCRDHPVVPAPTTEDLAVFYLPSTSEWQAACDAMAAAGFLAVAPFNPYWNIHGRTFEDKDGYRIVLQNDAWHDVAES
jgi:catechol 2,3-dioxygenase-like lactoylglutathione lyase family enzyme